MDSFLTSFVHCERCYDRVVKIYEGCCGRYVKSSVSIAGFSIRSPLSPPLSSFYRTACERRVCDSNFSLQFCARARAMHMYICPARVCTRPTASLSEKRIFFCHTVKFSDKKRGRYADNDSNRLTLSLLTNVPILENTTQS